MKRDEGFYWVRYKGEWEVAKYNVCGYWDIAGSEDLIKESVFEEINETKLNPPE